MPTDIFLISIFQSDKNFLETYSEWAQRDQKGIYERARPALKLDNHKS